MRGGCVKQLLRWYIAACLLLKLEGLLCQTGRTQDNINVNIPHSGNFYSQIKND